MLSKRACKSAIPRRIAAIAISFLTIFGFSQLALGQAQVQGQWRTLPYTMPVNPIHVALLHTGKVLAIGGSENYAPEFAAGEFRAAILDPVAGTVTAENIPWDMFCNGLSQLADGRILIAGGNLQYSPFLGLSRASIYDPLTDQYVDVPNMAHGRWYPTNLTLADGSVLVFSGLNGTNGATNSTIEYYRVGSGWSQEYPAGWTPPLYPRLSLLPNGKVFYSGSGPQSNMFDPSTQTWTLDVANTNFGGIRTYGSSVLLPLLAKNSYDARVMILGGGNPATASTEIIDLSAPNPVWVTSAPMSAPRIEMSAVILPSGKILALGGSLNDEDAPTAALNADLFDPASNTFAAAGTAAYPRLYHSTGLLLPDATVLVMGGNPTQGSYEPHMEIYSPAYLFTTDSNGNAIPATRPTITNAPGIVGYAANFTVQTPDAANIGSVALMRLGSPTHAFDFDQRMVGLNFTQGTSSITVTAPPNGNIAPPGYYMLFILNKSGVPSVASMVQISANPTDQPPKGSITSPASDITIGVGQTANFAGTATDADGTVGTYSWVIPGGSPSQSTLPVPGNVTFSTPGTYIASLTVLDNLGVNDPSPPTRTITVQPVPTLTSISPASGNVGQSINVTLTGSGFASGDVCNFGAGVTVNSCTFNGSTQLVAGLTISASAVSGGRTVSVTNAGGQNSSLQNAFVVTQSGSAPPPVLTGVAPNSGNLGQTLSVTLTGTNFQTGATCNFGSSITVNSCTFNSSTQLTASITIASGGTPGSIPVTVTNPDSQSSTLGSSFSIIGSGGLVHLDFNYPDRTSLINGGWSYIATTAGGAARDTEQTGTLAVSYDQTAHPNVLRIPVGPGENWQSLNNSQNTLFRALPSNWTSVRLMVSAFNPLVNYQQLGLQIYQNDDNYLDLNRQFANSQNIEVFQEVGQTTNQIGLLNLANTGNLLMRIDRSGNTYTGMYSTDGGSTYTVVASDTLVLSNAKLAIETGSNPQGPIPADLEWLEIVMSSPLPAPALSSASPNSAIQGQTLNVVLSGSNFQNGATCNFGTGVTVNSCAFNSVSQLTANISVAANASTGLRAITITNPDNQSATLNTGITINAPPPPTLSGIDPVAANTGQNLNVTMSGSNFQNGASCAFGIGVMVNSCTFNSSTQLTANISVAFNASVGTRNVTVTNPDTQISTLVNSFTVNQAPPPPPPTLSTASPNSGVPGATVSVVLGGSNFQSGATCSFGANVTVNSCTFNSPTQITAGVTISSTATSGYTAITVTNPDSQFSTLNNGFFINAPIHINFTYPDRTSLLADNWSYIATTAAGGSRNTEQSGSLAVSYDQTAHPGTIRIPLGSGEMWQAENDSQNMLVRTLPSNWTSMRLKIASYNPVANFQQVGLIAYQDDDNYVDLSRMFGSGAQNVEIFNEIGQSTTEVNRMQLTNTGNLILRIDRAGNTYTGSYSTDGGNTFTTVGSTTVTLNSPKMALQIGSNLGATITADLAWVEIMQSAPLPAPTLASAAPASANQGQTLNVVLTGTNFQTGATCNFGANITVSSCTFNSATQLTARITVAPTAPTDAQNVTITNPDAQSASLAGGFTITQAPAPSISGINVTSANQGTSAAVVISGANFQAGASCSFGSGITVNSCAFNSATQLTASISVAFNATVGTRTVTVTNVDTQSASLPNAFTVNQAPPPPPPTLTSINPTSGVPGNTLSVTMTGTNFISGATCSFGAGITVNSCTFNSAIQLTANITMPLGIGSGSRNVTVTNPDTQTSTLSNGFFVNGPIHIDFNYPDRNTLLSNGWSYIATTAGGGTRNTEQSGALAVSYDQTAHPGTIRIPLGSGELWQAENSSQNMLNRFLPSNWSTLRLKIASYNPVANFQQVGFLIYQDDDNYIDLSRMFGSGTQNVEMFQEKAQNTTEVNRVQLNNTGNLILRIDRSGSTYSGSYSTDGGVTFIALGSTTVSLSNPKMAIQVGSNLGSTITADLAWVEIVQPAGLAAPTVTSLSPSSAIQGATLNVTVAGANFQNGAYCSFGSGITVNSCAFNSSTQLTANVTIAPGATVGKNSVTVTNPDLQTATLANGFTINQAPPPPPPTLSSLNPASGFQGTTFTVNLNGSNFLSGATCSFGTGITVNSCTFNSSTQLAANITVSATAPTGTSSVTVTNPGGQTSTLANSFTVSIAPVINAGNDTVVVLVDSTNPTGYNTDPSNPGEFQRYAQLYLDHLQLPYVTVDVSTITPPSNLSSRALIMTGHAGVNLSSSWQTAITNAVSAGAGFVNLDYSTSIGAMSHIRAIFGATGAVQGTQSSSIDIPAALLPGGATPHFIDALQRKFLGDPAGDIVYNFHQNSANVVPTIAATVLQSATGTVIAKLGTDPLIMATAFGSGRAVNFGTYLYLQEGGFGFVEGVDDLFWRSLVWAARKPFVVRGYPRYFSVQMDDQLPGWGTTVEDLYNTAFTGNVAADGSGGPWKPTGFLFMDNLAPGSAERASVIADINAGKLEVSPHNFTDAAYGDFYWNQSNGALTDSQWLANFNSMLAWKTGNGGADAIPSFSRVIIGHYWDLSNNIADDMWNQGFRYITSVQKPGFQQPNVNINQYNGAERFHDKAFWQFDQPPKLKVDEDYPFFFADDLTVGSRAGLPSHTFYLFATQYHNDVLYPQRPDFIWPSTTNNQTVAQSVDQLERYVWRFWSGMAPVQLFTHDGGNYADATAANRDAVISQASTWLNSNGVHHLFMDDLGDYLYARNKSTLTDAQVSGSTIQLKFTGSAATANGVTIPTQLLIFKQDVEGVPVTVPGFTGGLTTTVSVP